MENNMQTSSIKVFGDRITEALTVSGYTTQRMADKLDLHPSSIQSYQTGRRWPRTEHLITISKLTGYSVDYLLGLSDEPHAQAPVSFDRAKKEEIAEALRQIAAAVESEEPKKVVDLKQMVMAEQVQWGGQRLRDETIKHLVALIRGTVD